LASTKTEQGKRKLLACFTTEHLHVSLKITWEKQTLKVLLLFPNVLTAIMQATSQFFAQLLLLAVR